MNEESDLGDGEDVLIHIVYARHTPRGVFFLCPIYATKE